jgi:hypothetical protein
MERVERIIAIIFSKYNDIWGWATWRRSWKNDFEMKGMAQV